MTTTVDIIKLFDVLHDLCNKEIDEMNNWTRRKENAGRRHDRSRYEYCRRMERAHRHKLKRLNTCRDELSLYWERAT